MAITYLNLKLFGLCGLMHVFDSIRRNKILYSLTQNKIPPKLIRLNKLTLENTTAKVKVNNAYTEEFRVENGAKQGDPLSPHYSVW